MRVVRRSLAVTALIGCAISCSACGTLLDDRNYQAHRFEQAMTDADRFSMAGRPADAARRYADAIEHLVQFEPNSLRVGAVHVRKGTMLLQHGDKPAAREAFTRANAIFAGAEAQRAPWVKQQQEIAAEGIARIDGREVGNAETGNDSLDHESRLTVAIDEANLLRKAGDSRGAIEKLSDVIDERQLAQSDIERNAMSLLAKCYWLNKDYSQSARCYQVLVDAYKEAGVDNRTIADDLRRCANAWIKLKDSSKAMPRLHEALALSETDRRLSASIRISMFDAFILRQDFESARSQAQQAKQIAMKLSDEKLVHEAQVRLEKVARLLEKEEAAR